MAPNVLVESFIPHRIHDNGITPFAAVYVLFDLGGLVNTCVYAILNQRAKRSVLRQQIEPSTSTSIISSTSTRSVHSFPVAFGETEEVSIPGDQAEVMRVAAKNARRLQKQNKHNIARDLDFLDSFNETRNTEEFDQHLADSEPDDEEQGGFSIGEAVQARGPRGDWQPGVVVSTSPLKIKLAGWNSEHSFSEVRHEQGKQARAFIQ